MIGLKKNLRTKVNQMRPVSICSLLLQLYRVIDFHNHFHIRMWAAMLFLFFTFFRRSNVLPTHASSFDCFLQYVELGVMDRLVTTRTMSKCITHLSIVYYLTGVFLGSFGWGFSQEFINLFLCILKLVCIKLLPFYPKSHQLLFSFIHSNFQYFCFM